MLLYIIKPAHYIDQSFKVQFVVYRVSLQQYVYLVTKFSEEIFSVTKSNIQ